MDAPKRKKLRKYYLLEGCSVESRNTPGESQNKVFDAQWHRVSFEMHFWDFFYSDLLRVRLERNSMRLKRETAQKQSIQKSSRWVFAVNTQKKKKSKSTKTSRWSFYVIFNIREKTFLMRRFDGEQQTPQTQLNNDSNTTQTQLKQDQTPFNRTFFCKRTFPHKHERVPHKKTYSNKKPFNKIFSKKFKPFGISTTQGFTAIKGPEP